jgi:polysaccharide pyruvyl transferase WcaK-like protein/glycosyltransferase involved in cell wall biosynthesis
VRAPAAVGTADRAPAVTIGLPVYNGERYLAESLDALLSQTFTDFELIVLDNASTDSTPDICRRYASADRRVRYVRRPSNVGAARNHNDVFAGARGRYLKWASHDDLYDRDLLRRCVDALEERPDAVLAHSWDALIDEDGDVISRVPYHLDTAEEDPARRLRSLLFVPGGNDFYGVMRAEAFRATRGVGSFHHADRTFVASLALQGPFVQVPQVLYYRRDHPGRGEHAPSVRARCTTLDPQRSDRLRHPVLRLHLEYVLAYLAAILGAPITWADRLRCLRHVGAWLTSRVLPGQLDRDRRSLDPAIVARARVRASRRRRWFAGRRRSGRRRVLAYGYYGIGNLGNEASLTSLRAYLAAAHPDARLSCLAVDAESVTRDHGIPATRLMSYRADARHGVLRRAVKGVGRILDVPRTFALVGMADVVVVPGSGALEPGLGIPPWGLPFWLFLVAVSCRLRGRELVLLSVGAQYATHPLTRFFYRWTVRLSAYASFRDDGSRDAVRAMGVDGPHEVYPDLAFALPAPDPAPVRAGHVAVAVMTFYGGPDDPRRGPVVREEYVGRMAQFVGDLLDRGRTVTLLIGDLADMATAREVEGAVRSRRTGLGAEALRVSDAATLDEVMAEMATAEVVVASRFHSVIAALKVCRPTVTLAYAAKNGELLTSFGLPGLSQPIDGFDLERLHRQVDELTVVGDGARCAMHDTLDRFDTDLQRQFRKLSGRFFGTTRLIGGS